ncbi:MAG: hypothetical protein ACRDRA_22160 [Pseudonocardiaceae bacterium]
MSDDEDLWSVEPSEAVADALVDPRLPVDQFAKIVALTVAIAQDPWLPGSRTAEQGEPWRTVPIPEGASPTAQQSCSPDGCLRGSEDPGRSSARVAS